MRPSLVIQAMYDETGLWPTHLTQGEVLPSFPRSAGSEAPKGILSGGETPRQGH